MPFGSAKIMAGCEIVPIPMPENKPIPSLAKSPRQESLQIEMRDAPTFMFTENL
jgi:hypothetical protein